MTLKVLLVDDHPPLRLGIRGLIQQAYPHAEISEAGNADEAFKAIAAQEFDLIFLDAKLPARKGEADLVETGKQALTRIREEDGPPVVVMSGEGSNRALVEEMMALGAQVRGSRADARGNPARGERRRLAASGDGWSGRELTAAREAILVGPTAAAGDS
jgi:CheY-like chemotaxis protein